MAAQTDRGIPLSALSPKFLHTNSTSHTWPFSAIAELIDNAYDPDVSAKQFWIDKTRIKGLDCLTFMDNGAGMSYDKMHKMLSFGFSDKQAINGHVPVGLYGNGFKSGSMRLGKDAIVFSKTRDTMCVGLLSQTYLEAVQASHVVVPIVTFARVGHNQFRALPEHAASLQDILRYSLFKTEAELFSELRAINATCSTGSSGTRIIIWNLRRMSTGQPEFDFNVNRYDIQIPADVFESTSEKYKRQDRPFHSVPESDYSLRAYCSILYLKPRMQIVIRGQKVKTQLISKSLAYIAKDHYRPIFLNKRIRITFGYNTKSKEQYGIMMYHKNRLIKAYERVGCQLKANNRGVGVIGVIECNFLKPTHNKQDFDYTDEYRKTIYNLGVKLEEYWNEIRFKRDREDPNCTIPVEDTMKRPDQNWVQCDNCLKWRKLPDGIDCNLLPEKWFCHMNPDPQFRTCHAEEEPEDSDDDQPSYQKTYKQQERYNKMQQERNRQQMEQAKKKVEMERIAALAQQNETLRRQHEDLKRQLKQSNLQAQSPGTISQTPHSTVTNGTPQSTTRAGTGVTPSSATMPIISSVCSLSTPSRMKRTLPLNPEGTEPKRGRPNGLHKRLSTTEPAVSAETRSSSPVIIPDDDDDDILIVEASSTPRPGPSNFDLAKVKTERRVSEDPAGMHMECTDDAAVDVPSESTTTVTASASPAAPSPAAATESVTTATTTSMVTVSTTPTTDTTTSSAAVSPAIVEMAAVTEVPSASSSPRPQQLVSTMTQTEANQQVKDEEEEQRRKDRENEERRKQHGAMQEEERREEQEVAHKEVEEGIVVKMEKEADERSGAEEPGAEPVSESGLAPRADRAPPTGGGAELSAEQKEQLLRDAQQQQDQLMELMQAVAQERDQYQAQVHQLTCKVQDLETQLEELSHSVVKKELCDQAVGTEELGEDEEAGLLYQRTKQEVEELRRELERQEAMGRTDRESGREEEMKSCEEDELAIQVDALFRDLDQSNKEKDELQSRLGFVEGQRNSLLSQCEQLRRELEQLQAQVCPSKEVCPETHLTGEATPGQHAPLRTADGAAVQPADPSADAMESNGSMSPDANGRTADCSDGGVSNGTGESCRNGDVLNGAEDPCADGGVSTQSGDLSGEEDLPNDITGNGVGGRTQNVCNKPGPTDQADGLASLRKNMTCLLVASLPKLYPERVNDSALAEQVLDEFFSRIASLGHDVESCPPS